MRAEEIRRLLAGVPILQNACDLDLMAFLHRHPRTLLTSEQLAGFVGYSPKDIAKTLDAFIEAGLLARTTQRSLHAARMFVLLLDGPQGEGVRALLELGSTRAGRQSILEVLNG
jgi:DNA-binding MarR family transcriptional regulator